MAEPEGCGHLREVGVPLPQGDARSGQDPSGQGENVLYSTYLRGKIPVVRKKNLDLDSGLGLVLENLI